MTTNRGELLRFIKAIGEAIDGLNEQQYHSLIQGKGKLIYKDNKCKTQKGEIDKEDVKKLAEKILEFTTREEASKFLNQHKKAKLTALANYLQIYVQKSDTKARIIEKIIESVIGAKLKTEAIKTIDLKRTNSKD